MTRMRIIFVLIFFMPHLGYGQYPSLVDSIIVHERSDESSIIVSTKFGESKHYLFRNGENLCLIVHAWLEDEYDSISNDWKFEFHIDSMFILNDSILLTHSVNNTLIHTWNYSLTSAIDSLGNRVVSLDDNLSDLRLSENHIFVTSQNGLISEKLESFSERNSEFSTSEWQRINKSNAVYIFGLDTYYFGTQIHSKKNKIIRIITLDWTFLDSPVDYESAIFLFKERSELDYWTNEYKVIRLYNNEVWHEPNPKKIIKAYKMKNGLMKNGIKRRRV
jgi:hypothetical protein